LNSFRIITADLLQTHQTQYKQSQFHKKTRNFFGKKSNV
jgi:hypothetical protein